MLQQKNINKQLQEKYVQISQLQHININPDMYVGSIEQTIEKRYIIENEELVYKNIP